MGLTAYIYKNALGDSSNGGISATASEVCVVNAEGPFGPGEDIPAVMLVKGNLDGTVKIVPAEQVDGVWQPVSRPGANGPMFGGCYVGTSDSRLGEKIAEVLGVKRRTTVVGRMPFFDGIAALHDRFEVPA